MKKIFLLLALFSLLGCEKDDICDENTATTPLLVINFYYAENPSVERSVSDLKITADGMTEFGTFSGTSVKIPLNSNANTTKYEFVLNSGSETLKNTDYLEFNYVRNNVYVSRACGYKTIFTLNDTNGIVQTDADPTDLLWIDYTLLTSNIENPNETHLKILF